MGMPGPLELLIVLVTGLLSFGVPVAILVVVIILFLRQRGESDALRNELEELKSKQRNAPE